jgi:hypothetical protein
MCSQAVKENLMPRIKIDEVGQGQHPSEVLISISTSTGKTTLIVDRRSIQNSSIDIGYPVGSDGEFFLVELPRETMSGEWRVLVPSSLFVNNEVVSA